MLNCSYFFFFFNDTATTEIYTLSLHDALPISRQEQRVAVGRGVLDGHGGDGSGSAGAVHRDDRDRKSTRLNSSHLVISYAVFCLKKKDSIGVLQSRWSRALGGILQSMISDRNR